MKLLMILFVSFSAMAFTPPSDITPYKPANNVVVVTPIVSGMPNVDQYDVSDTTVLVDRFGNCTSFVSPGLQLNSCIYSVSAGTSLKLVNKLAAGNNAWAKFKAATLTPAEQVNPTQLQTAMIWFFQHIYVLY